MLDKLGGAAAARHCRIHSPSNTKPGPTMQKVDALTRKVGDAKRGTETQFLAGRTRYHNGGINDLTKLIDRSYRIESY